MLVDLVISSSLLLLLTISLFAAVPEMNISYQIDNELPPDIHRDFGVMFQFSRFHILESAIVVYLVNATAVPPLQTFVFSPGSVETQTQELADVSGAFFTVLEFAMQRYGKVRMRMRLLPPARDHSLAIFYTEQYDSNATVHNGQIMYQATVACNVTAPARISLLIGEHSSGPNVALLSEQMLYINCSARIEHEPYVQRVVLEGLLGIGIIENGGSSMDQYVFVTVTRKSHNSRIVCRSGNFNETRTIKIYHPPPAVRISPPVLSESTLLYNSPIYCSVVDNDDSPSENPLGLGYPAPRVQWVPKIQSQNGSAYYRLINDGTGLVFHRKLPHDSRWLFYCTASNTIPGHKPTEVFQMLQLNIPAMSLPYRKIIIILVPVVLLILLILVSVLRSISVSRAKRNKIPIILPITRPNSLFPNEKLHNPPNEALLVDPEISSLSSENIVRKDLRPDTSIPNDDRLMIRPSDVNSTWGLRLDRDWSVKRWSL